MKKTRIMYIERKAGELVGPARIGRVSFSKTGLTIYYRGQAFHRISGFKANYADSETGDEYWISGPKKNGQDGLYPSNETAEIDEDVREEYWTTIRKKPQMKDRTRS